MLPTSVSDKRGYVDLDSPPKRPDPERASRLRAVQLEEDVDDVDG